MGGFLVALTTFQAEFDFGVPQFRAVHQPILIMLAAGIGLTGSTSGAAAPCSRCSATC